MPSTSAGLDQPLSEQNSGSLAQLKTGCSVSAMFLRSKTWTCCTGYLLARRCHRPLLCGQARGCVDCPQRSLEIRQPN